MNYPNILLEVSEQIATLTVNRPQAMNALTVPTLEELEHAFLAMEQDPQVRVMLVTGAGEKAFVAGGDISYLVSLDPVAARALEIDLQRANLREADLFALCFGGAEQKEGMQAFLEKRPARFP